MTGWRQIHAGDTIVVSGRRELVWDVIPSLTTGGGRILLDEGRVEMAVAKSESFEVVG